MIRSIITIVILVSVITNVHAQSPARVIFFEIGGPGLASVNYDTRFTRSESGIGGRVGVGGFSFGGSGEKATVIFIPLGINYVMGKDERHYFEVGGGVTPVILSQTLSGSNDNFHNTFGHIDIAYRLQPKEGGFFFKAAITPIFNKNFFWPYYGGISLGYKL